MGTARPRAEIYVGTARPRAEIYVGTARPRFEILCGDSRPRAEIYVGTAALAPKSMWGQPPSAVRRAKPGARLTVPRSAPAMASGRWWQRFSGWPPPALH